nr:hypothetical protein [Tanacetum cinerariifolium]
MVRDSIQLETAVNTISAEYLLDFTSEYGIPETLHPELPGSGDRIVDFPEGKVDERVLPTVVDWRTNASKDRMPANGTYSVEAVRTLDTHRTPIQKQPEMLLCLVEIDLFSLIRAPNPTKVKFGSRPRAPHEVPLLTLTATRVIEMDEPAVVTDSSGVPSTIERSPLDFAHEAEAFRQGQNLLWPERAVKEAMMGLMLMLPKVFLLTSATPIHWLLLTLRHPILLMLPSVAAVGDPESENVSSPAEVGSPGSVYRPEWGVTNGSLLDTPKACQDLVDHAAPLGYFSELRHMHNEEFFGQYNMNLARQVACRDQRIQARKSEIKNLEALLETEAGMKRAAEEKSDGLSQELERMRAQFSEVQVSNERLSQQVDALQRQVSGEETLKAAFEDYKRQQDQMVKQRCAEMDARLDALSIDFDEELYPHMLTAIVCRRHERGPEAWGGAWACPTDDRLEGLKDAPMDVIMVALYLESDTEGDAPQSIRDLRPSSSQLSISVYPEVRDPRNPWVCKKEIGLADAIAANISRAEQKKRSRIVCRTHGVGSAHHARSDRVPVSAPIVVPQGLALLLVDAAMQTESDDA